MKCFECDAEAQHEHHVIPRVLGGKRTVPLCELHHGLVHERGMMSHTRLTKMGMARRKARGLHLGGIVPYGYKLAKDGETLVKSEDEQAAISAARRLRRYGLSLRAVAETLEEAGFRTRTGSRFAPSAIAGMCRGVEYQPGYTPPVNPRPQDALARDRAPQT